MDIIQQQALDEQQKGRPLALMQSLSDSEDEESDDENVKIPASNSPTKEPAKRSPEETSTKHRRRPVLKDNDTELFHVANLLESLGTVKVRAAQEKGGIYIVTPNWLYHSALKWRRMKEEEYSFGAGQQVKGLSKGQPLAQEVDSTRQKDVDDEDLAALTDEATPEKVVEEIVTRLGKDDWREMDDEVDAAMNEDDEEEDGGTDDEGGERATEGADENDGDVLGDENGVDENEDFDIDDLVDDVLNEVANNEEGEPRKRGRNEIETGEKVLIPAIKRIKE
ncbi:hypothetical protein HK405_006521 [Cladochytrium tenue]|nr:hypothetical protein HK405_006521 [Cladochytrium tenue]